jgi:hypothetical protein
MKKILYTLLLVPFLVFAQNENPCYSINDIFIQMDGENPSLEVNLVAGWNMIGYPCTQDMLLTDGFSSIDDKISLVKNNNGAVYLPEFNFNGIGFLESGQGYQIKMNEFVMGFSFCQSVQYPTLEGCTDCEAVNFNQLATTDDGSCNYDSDGDGIDDNDEIVGCQDSNACNYNVLATDAGECIFAEEGYNCDGSIIPYIGLEAFGGMIFYLDETGQRGLVAAPQDNIILSYYEWGCYQTSISTSSREAIGTGYQNTLDIVAECVESNIAASMAIQYESNGFDDWYLPSRDELLEMYYSIGQGSSNGNLGGFGDNWYWTSTEIDAERAWAFDFADLDEIGYKHYNNSVWPIRAFGNWTMGCMDITACNFNTEANMENGTCEYPESGFHCDGSEVEIGDFYRGGIVFYIDDSNHGLISLDHDMGEYGYGVNNQMAGCANAMTIGTGLQNTICLDIIYSGNAATQCLNYEHLGYDDWYLPSRDELLEMMYTISQNSPLGNVGNFSFQSFYWSSSEETINAAYKVWFDPTYGQPIGAYGGGKQNSQKVRPIRSF